MFFQVLFEAELSRAKPNPVEPSRAKPSRAEPSQAQPRQTEPSRPAFHTLTPDRLFSAICYCVVGMKNGRKRRKEKGKEMEKKGKQKEMKEEKGRENAQPVQA